MFRANSGAAVVVLRVESISATIGMGDDKLTGSDVVASAAPSCAPARALLSLRVAL